MTYSSYGNYFAFDSKKSNSSFYYYKYHFGTKNPIQFYVIIEDYEITFKKVELQSDKKDSGFLFEDLLIIPKSGVPNSYVTIEGQLIRVKESNVFESRNKDVVINSTSSMITFEGVLSHFIEDLYVNCYFKEPGDPQIIKNALENIPILKGIVYKKIHDFYKKKYQDTLLKNELEIEKCHKWSGQDPFARKEHYKSRYEDAYVTWSKFLSDSVNEGLFRRGGWFYEKKHKIKHKNIFLKIKNIFHTIVDFISCFVKTKYGRDIDDEIIRVEKGFILGLNNDKEGFSTSPTNFKSILKRYGIIDILRLITPKVSNWFKFSLIVLLSLILVDILGFNLEWDFTKTPEFDQVYASAILVFLIITVYIALYSIYKWNLLVFPGIFLPRLTIALISGWIIFLTAEELLKIDIHISGWNVLGIFIGVVAFTLVFMLYEVNNYAPSMNYKRVIGRSLFVIGLAFVLSYTFGFWVMSHINEKFMSIDNFIINESDIVKSTETVMEHVKKMKSIGEEYEDLFSDFTPSSLQLTRYDDKESKSKWTVNEGKKGKDEARRIRMNIKNKINKIENTNRRAEKMMDEIACLRGVFPVIDSITYVHFTAIQDSIKSFINDYVPSNRLVPENWFAYDKSLQKKLRGAIIKNLQSWEKGVKKEKDRLAVAISKIMEQLPKSENSLKVHGAELKSKTYSFFTFEKMTFPNVIFVRSLLALFVGIFLQLIFQDKSITEPI